MPDEPDLDDIAAVLEGDRDRFRLLVERYQRPLLALARSFVRDEGRVEDLVQETFVAAYVHLRRFDASRGRFATWIFAIARNRCRDALRRTSLPVRSVEDRRAPPADADRSRALDGMLDALPTDLRLAFLLADVFGLPRAEVAVITDVPIGTVKSRVFRARARLREALAEPTPTPTPVEGPR